MTATAKFEKHRNETIVHDLRRLLFTPSRSKVDFTLLDLAQKTMDGFKDGVGGPSTFGSKEPDGEKKSGVGGSPRKMSRQKNNQTIIWMQLNKMTRYFSTFQTFNQITATKLAQFSVCLF